MQVPRLIPYVEKPRGYIFIIPQGFFHILPFFYNPALVNGIILQPQACSNVGVRWESSSVNNPFMWQEASHSCLLDIGRLSLTWSWPWLSCLMFVFLLFVVLSFLSADVDLNTTDNSGLLCSVDSVHCKLHHCITAWPEWECESAILEILHSPSSLSDLTLQNTNRPGKFS